MTITKINNFPKVELIGLLNKLGCCATKITIKTKTIANIL